MSNITKNLVFNKVKKIAYFILLIFLFFGLRTIAQEPSLPVSFPIKELGNCENKQECALFCDKPENTQACTNFALKHGFITKEKAEKTEKVLEKVRKGGPGGCQSPEECRIYCEGIAHLDECIAFTEKEGIISSEELKEAKNVAKAIKKGAVPPGNCQSKKECDKYCSQPEHLEVCLNFAEAAGIMPKKEIEMARKTGGQGPGGCRGKEECDKYCQNPEHTEECIEFGLKHNLMPAKEAEEAKKMLAALKKGIKPPPCQGPEECDKYCSQPEHLEECLNFAEAAGIMSAEEINKMKKMKELGILTGPGSCKGKEECEKYCDSPEHMEECLEFAVKTGFMTSEEAEKAKKMAQLRDGPGGCQGPEECDGYCSDPAHQEECMKFGLEHGLISPEEVEKMKKGAEIIKKGGPGGCQSEEECKQYCDSPEHMEECHNFALEQGLISQEEAEKMKKFRPEGSGGPGGCRTKEECETYCSNPEHLEECLNFSKEEGLIKPEEAEKMREIMELHNDLMAPVPKSMPIMPLPGIKRGEKPPEIPPSEIMPKELPIGPGGCQSSEECEKYCSDPVHFEECKNFKTKTAPMPEIMPEDVSEYGDFRKKELPEKPEFSPEELLFKPPEKAPSINIEKPAEPIPAFPPKEGQTFPKEFREPIDKPPAEEVRPMMSPMEIKPPTEEFMQPIELKPIEPMMQPNLEIYPMKPAPQVSPEIK